MVGKVARSAGIMAAAIGVAIAGASAAQAPDPNNKASVDAWKTAQKITPKVGAATWQEIGTDPDAGLLMRGVIAQRDPTSNQASVGVRVEHFAAVPGPGGIQALSELQQFAVDCAAAGGGRVKQVSTAFYPQHNMGGDMKSAPATDDWSPASDIPVLGPEIQAACKTAAAPSAGGVSGMGLKPAATFNIRDANQGKQWINDQKILQGGSADTPDWPLIGFTTEAAMFRSAVPDAAKTTARTTPRYVIREEFYGPVQLQGGKTALSESIDYDVACARSQIRKVTISLYTARNLTGDAVTTPVANADFVPVATDPVMKSVFDEICQATDTTLEQSQAGKFSH